jgi:uracil-DNA glycosylase family 4
MPGSGCSRCEFSAGCEKEVPAKIPSSPIAAVIGSYPNVEDEKSGQPFADVFGKLLKQALLNEGIDESDLIFLYTLRCSPRGKSVKDVHLNACRNWVDQDLKKLRTIPDKLVLICGKDAMDSLLYELNLEGGYVGNRGQWIEHKGWSYLITFPPKYVSELAPFRSDLEGKWWVPAGSVPYFWFQDIKKFATRVKELKYKSEDIC